jgi:hypothetical protein
VIGLALVAGWTSGLSLYGTVLVLGIGSRLTWFELPPGMEVLATSPVLVGALLLYGVEFLADKIPWLDSLWDVLHTPLRPIGGALLAWLAAGGDAETAAVLTGLGGGGTAAAAHAAKASTRLALNASPEPFTNMVASVLEDGLVAAALLLAFTHPAIALGLVTLLVLASSLLLWTLARTARKAWDRLRINVAARKRGRSEAVRCQA